MKILLVNKFHFLKGGSEKYYFELAKLLKKNGHEVAFFSMTDERNIKTGEKEYFVKSIDLNNGSKLKALNIIYSKENKKKMIEALNDFKPHIVHLNNFQRQLSASIIDPIKKRNIPIVYTAHDMNSICPSSAMLYNGKICEDCIKNGYKSCIQKKCLKNSRLKSILGVLEFKYYKIFNIYKKFDCIISPSEFIKNQLNKGNLKYKEIKVLHNFVTKTDLIERKDDGYAFYFGRLSIEKGILNLVKSIKNIENGKLMIAGDGPERVNIEKYIKENELSDKIRLLGYLSQDEIRDYIRRAKFIVVPSIWYENCPYSILETMEIGKPIIGSRIGGIPELIEENKNGFLYEYSDINDLTNKMHLLFENQELVVKQSNMSKKIFEEKYSEERYYDGLMNIYKNLLGEKDV